MVYAFQVYTGFQWTGYFAGEIRNARRTATTSIIGGLVASAVIYIVGVALIYHYYGFNFFGALVFIGLGRRRRTAAVVRAVPAGPGQVHRAPRRCCATWSWLAFVLAIFWWTPTGFMLGTRNLFAWSFDRLMPTGITRVSEKNHTPVVAIASIAAFVELLNYLNVYQNLGAYLLNLIAVLGLGIRHRLDRGDRHAVPQARSRRGGAGLGQRPHRRDSRDLADRARLGRRVGVRRVDGVPHGLRRRRSAGSR